MSKELEALEFICKILKEKGIDIKWLFKEQYNTIKQVLIKAQEQEKMLKIVFEKNVNTLLLELSENVDEYNKRIVPNGQLTQEEFNSLKEVVKCIKK